MYMMGYYSATQRKEIVQFPGTRIDLETVTQKELNQKEKNKYHMTSFWRRKWNLEKWNRRMYLQSINRDTDVENKFMDTEG